MIDDNPNDFHYWLMLRPGLGHFEINMVKFIFNLTWDVVMELVAQLLDFKSSKALEYANSATDRRKAWEIVLVMLHGTMDELLVLYVQLCLELNNRVSVRRFEQYIFVSEDETLILV
jgi:hypothetical protein